MINRLQHWSLVSPQSHRVDTSGDYQNSVIIKLEKDILVFNTVMKFHKAVIKITGLIETMVYFHKQRVITPECMVRYGPYRT